MKTIILFLLAIISIVGCSPTKTPNNPPASSPANEVTKSQPRHPPHPTALRARIGGGLSTSYEVALMGKTVVYSRSSRTFSGTPNVTKEINPSNEDWAAFRKAIDKANVWSWKDDYTDPSIMDGTEWSIHLEYEDKKINSSGKNGYPNRDEFDKMSKAVSALVGGLDFKKL
ncbi:MAG: hypothetical protein GY847_04855 [Proteobacteria bacterium]|nr:hypothetical protein [Pseudomonadota bacterium]